MNFNTALFLFLFLPAFLVIYLVARPHLRLWIALGASLLFYAWGQVFYIPLMLGVIWFNYRLGLRLAQSGADSHRSLRGWLVLGIVANAGILIFFKMLVTFGIGPFEQLMPERIASWLQSLIFPLGLSYISFQVISYLLDIYSGSVKAERKLLNFSVYVLLFPKLLVGPIARYRSLADQLAEPTVSRELVAEGIRRFLQGFAKKVLIADVLAKLVNAVFDQSGAMIQPHIAWLALAAYALQIYFDFSGYTDMAIGLGRMMGFRFIENFNYPYISQSIGEFWRRWHISLSSWFRDYVFYPLERRRIRFIGQPLNILIVFLLTGLWHGLAPTYVVWGLLHGIFIAFEGLFLGRALNRLYRPFRHAYAVAAILLTWLVFRSPSPAFALEYLSRLAGNTAGITTLPFTLTSPLPFIEPSFWLAFFFAVLLSMPVAPLVESMARDFLGRRPNLTLPLTALNDFILLFLFVLAVGAMTSSKFLPGIYGRF
ncbi:MAG TPA: MBOAT family O-acyltransferase [Anaerolineales bacterium]